MTFRASFWRSAPLLLAVLLASGCPSGPVDEEKEPHYLAGKARVNAMDYKGAVESFEKALEVNPQSAAAHLELGVLFDQKEGEPASAIYHYEKYLKLAPNAGNAEMVRTRILASKQELARTVSLGPVTQTLQKEFEQLTEENKRLREESDKWKAEVEKWRAYYAARGAPTNPTPVVTPTRMVATSGTPGVTIRTMTSTTGPVQVVQSGGGASNTSTTRTTPVPPPRKTHVVKEHETAGLIARMYGVKLDALMAANPKLEPRRMQVGQVLNIP